MAGRPQRDPARELGEYFSGRPEVVLAYLFGSRAGGRPEPESDYDFGILLRPGTEPACRYELAHELGELLRAQGLDIVLLDGAPIELAFNVIAEGRLIYERDLAERVEFEAGVMSRYGDYLPVLRRQRQDVLKEAGV